MVYQITCANCPATYVGETERPLAKRLKEHQHPGSPVSDHLVEHNHNFTMFTKEDVAVKYREKDWFRRGVAESIYTAEGRPSLNRDRGRHTVPLIYRQLLSSRDPSDPNRESRDDAETSVF